MLAKYRVEFIDWDSTSQHKQVTIVESDSENPGIIREVMRDRLGLPDAQIEVKAIERIYQNYEEPPNGE